MPRVQWGKSAGGTTCLGGKKRQEGRKKEWEGGEERKKKTHRHTPHCLVRKVRGINNTQCSQGKPFPFCSPTYLQGYLQRDHLAGGMIYPFWQGKGNNFQAEGVWDGPTRWTHRERSCLGMSGGRPPPAQCPPDPGWPYCIAKVSGGHRKVTALLRAPCAEALQNTVRRKGHFWDLPFIRALYQVSCPTGSHRPSRQPPVSSSCRTS